MPITSAAMRMLSSLLLVIAAPAGAAPAQDALSTYRDWTVACDNVGRCVMASLGPEAGDFPAWTIEVTREAGPAGAFAIAIDSLQDEAGAPRAVSIDGQRFTLAGDALAGAGAARMARAMADGRALRIEGAGGRVLGRVSLAGAAAALRHIDAAQGRAGTVTAAVARGARPARTVPAAPPVPVIVAPALSGVATQPSATQLAEMRRIGACETREGEWWTPAAHAVGGGATLVVLPCSAGAYNMIGALFVIAGGQVRPAAVDAPAGFDATGADSQTPVRSVVNATFDGGVLSSYAKGRGLGDCGVAQDFVWDGARLRLIEQRAMGECRGNPHFLRTWHARLVRR